MSEALESGRYAGKEALGGFREVLSQFKGKESGHKEAKITQETL